MKHILPTELVNKVLNYLASRPFNEVATLINEIQSNAVQYLDGQPQQADLPVED